MSTRPRPGLTTRAKNANQRPGKILMSYRRTRRSSPQLATDKKAAKKATAVIATKNAAIVAHLAQLEDAHLNLCHASTVGKSTSAIEEPRSDDGGVLGNQSSLAASVQVRKRTEAPEKPSSADHQVYDIVSIAQMILAELASSKEEATTLNSFSDIEPQWYALCSYYSHRK